MERKASDKTRENLEEAIHSHFSALWSEMGDDLEGTVIVHWMVPIFYRELKGPQPSWGYSVETSESMAEHEMRGLLGKADDWITEQVMGD